MNEHNNTSPCAEEGQGKLLRRSPQWLWQQTWGWRHRRSYPRLLWTHGCHRSTGRSSQPDQTRDGTCSALQLVASYLLRKQETLRCAIKKGILSQTVIKTSFPCFGRLYLYTIYYLEVYEQHISDRGHNLHQNAQNWNHSHYICKMLHQFLWKHHRWGVTAARFRKGTQPSSTFSACGTFWNTCCFMKLNVFYCQILKDVF